MLNLRWPPERIEQLQGLVQARAEYPALRAVGARKKLPTHNDRLFYAFVRTTPARDQEVLVVLNFQKNHRLIRVRMDTPARLTDIATHKTVEAQTELELALPPYGYRIYIVER
jgi:hypothetical protein